MGRSKRFWLMLFVFLLFSLFISFLVLPKFIFSLVSSSEKTSFNEVNYHSSLQYTLSNSEKKDKLKDIFSDIFSQEEFRKVNVILTDIPQIQKITWVNKDNQIVNHLGFDVYPEGDNLSVYLYNNTAVLKDLGWDAEKIAKENEILLIKALMYYRGWSIEKINQEAKNLFLSLYNQYPEPLFLMNYDF